MEAFFQLLHDQKNHLVLTANQRLATHIREKYKDFQTRQAHSCWETPCLKTVENWLDECYEFALEQGLTDLFKLNSLQESILWENLLTSFNRQHNLYLQPWHTAKTLQQAWTTLQQWLVPLEQNLFLTHSDNEIFYQIAKEFKSLCQSKQWIDVASSQQKILHFFENQQLTFPELIILTGFVEITPLLQALLNLAKQQGTRVIEWQETHHNTPVFIKTHHTRHELEVMAQWAKNWVEKGETGNIICVLPHLNEVRSQADRIFSTVFQDKIPYNISGGIPILRYPIIQTALRILSLNPKAIDTLEFGQILLSPYIGNYEHEKFKRANLDIELRRKSDLHFELSRLLGFLEKSVAKNWHCSLLYAQLLCLKQQHDHKPLTESPHYWAHFFLELLNILGWPGTRIINSLEHQLLQRWQTLLIEFSQLETISPTLTYTQAVQYLHYMAQTCMFQEKTENTQVQVLGLLEAIGLPCTHLWVANFTDHIWPAPASPNPFIPFWLQKEREMPHASPDKESGFSKKVMRLFAHTALNVYYSYPESQNDIIFRASPLITCLKQVSLQDLHLSSITNSHLEAINSITPEIVTETYIPYENTTNAVEGGSSVFKNQAACPFKAFATHRLHAKAIDLPEMGLKKMDQGTFLHACLEQVWKIINTHEQLMRLTDIELHTITAQTVKDVLNHPEKYSLKKIHSTFKEIEEVRLIDIILKWLNYETNRFPFTVAGTEYVSSIHLQDLQFSIKVDRVDKIDDGNYLIIDYKTGADVSLKRWDDDRPDEPQLPLYAVTFPHPVSGIFFGKINNYEQKLIGTSCLPNIVPAHKGITSTEWDEKCQSWKVTLDNLANEFKQGIASVTPKYGPQEEKSSCSQCDLHSLCRIHEESNRE